MRLDRIYFSAAVAACLLSLATACQKITAYYPHRDIDYSEWVNDDLQVEDTHHTLKVMSSNVRYASAPDMDERNWNNRKTGWTAMLNTIRPTVCGIQECEAIQIKDISEACPDYDYYGVSREDGQPIGAGEHMFILYLRDSLSLGEHGTIWLSDTPDVPSRYPLAGNYRTATWAKFKVKSTGEEFMMINTHLDFEMAQEFEMGCIMKLVDDKSDNLPVVMTADWNALEDSYIFTQMYESFLSARQTGSITDSYNTYNGYRTVTGESRIDHIFYRGFYSCRSFTTDRSKWEGYQFISDHFPVYAVLNFE